MSICVECKACKRECPTGVDMARLKSEFLHQYQAAHGVAWQTRLLGRMDRLSRWGSRLAPLSNWVLGTGLVRRLNERLLGLDPRRPLPTFARQSFVRRWGERPISRGTPTVAIFADTFNNYYEPENLEAMAAVASATGASVAVAPNVCCGRPLLSKGLLTQARQQAQAVVTALSPLAEAGTPILFAEPSCHSAIIDDYPLLLQGELRDKAGQLAEMSLLLEQWLPRQPKQPTFKHSPQRLIVHGHCHQKALIGVTPLISMLKRLPGAEVVTLDSGCCGLAGMFGYEQYDVSAAIGERRLLPVARALRQDERLLAPGFSCRHQSSHLAGVMPLHPASLLAARLKDSPGNRAL